MNAVTGYLPIPKSFETICLHHAQDPKQWKSQAIIPHIVTSTIFHIDDPAKPLGFLYSRFQNPNRLILERVIAILNQGKHGFCFASGLSTITGIFGILKAGDHIVACDEMDSEKFAVFTRHAKNLGIHTSFADFRDTNSICSTIQDNTKLLWTECPTDATMQITDICSVARIAKSKNILFAVDNSYLTPYFQRPLELGADIACQSVTKYMNGHSDISMGSMSIKREDILKDSNVSQIILGLIPSPFDCFQALRGMRTLHLRMQEHQRKSLLIANFLESHSAVERVLHPGLESHPQHELLKQQASGCGGVFSIYLKAESQDVIKFVTSLNYFTLTEVTSGTESTISIPAIMSHKDLTEHRKKKLSITDNLVKISVGLENVCDLILDLEKALNFLKK